MELLLKHSRQRDFFNYLEKLKKSGKFKILLRSYDGRYMQGILLFIADVLDSKQHPIEEVTNLFSDISPEIDTDIMTVRQAMIHEGKQEGILQTAKNMLNHGIDFSLVKKTTGLSKKQIEELKKQ